MSLRTRPNLFPVHCDIDTKQIMRTSRMVATYTGISVQVNKAIVGANAFAHECRWTPDVTLQGIRTHVRAQPAIKDDPLRSSCAAALRRRRRWQCRGRMRELQRQCIHVRVDCLHMPIRLHKRVCQIGRQAVIRRTARKGSPVDFDRLLQTLRSVQRRGKASDKFSLRRRERERLARELDGLVVFAAPS